MLILNQLGKSDKMRGLPSILLLFRNKFNKDIKKTVGKKYRLHLQSVSNWRDECYNWDN